MNEWMLRKATKVHVYVQCFIQAWEDLLKFDSFEVCQILFKANIAKLLFQRSVVYFGL